MEFPCTNCSNKVTADSPKQEIINADKFSVLVIVHESVPVCPNCGQEFIYAIAGGKLSCGWKAVEPEADTNSAVIIPRHGSA